MERLILLLAASALAGTLGAQAIERDLRKGNADYQKGNLPAAVEAFSKADKDERGMFNLGNAYYRQDSMAAAQRAYENAASMAKGGQAQANAYHNLGNSWMNQKKYQEAVHAYKEALKRNPDDADTRYNLAYAQKMLAAQQQQQQQGDKNKDQQNKDQQNK
ncbi:MAG: tetratricopeptide repeat protein, partial [Bacteroidetes bacterium]|nr:tetratricopeptide repeat protein [Bacteroidota bacterium]